MQSRKQRDTERRILADLRPLGRKYPKRTLRWALNRWSKTESARASLLKQKNELEKELARLEAGQ